MNNNQPGKRRRCPTGKLKIFNEAWADIVAQDQSARLGSNYRGYRCRCGWWHTYDRSKKHHKESARESRRARRKRTARGEMSPLQLEHMERERLRREAVRETRRRKETRRRQRRSRENQLALQTWEDDGGVWLPSPDEHRHVS